MVVVGRGVGWAVRREMRWLTVVRAWVRAARRRGEEEERAKVERSGVGKSAAARAIWDAVGSGIVSRAERDLDGWFGLYGIIVLLIC